MTFEALAASVTDIAGVRGQLAQRLREWGCRNRMDVLLVASELVTNAVVHANGTARLVAAHSDGVVRLEVHDDTRAIPALRDHADAGGGFGLRIVDQLSTAWGWTQTSSGKHVWSLIPCGDATTA